VGPTSEGGPAGARTILVAAAAAAALLAPTAARAQKNEPVIGVLRIDTTGVSDAAEVRFEQGVADGLAGAGFRVMDRASVDKALIASTGYVAGCSFGPCLRAVRDATGVETVLVARIEGVGRTYSFVVSLMDTRSGQLLSQVAQNCSVCTVEDAITTATLSAVELVLGVDAERTPRAAAAPKRPPPPSAPRPGGRALRAAGWTGLVLGVAAMAGGVLVYDKQDRRWGAGIGGAGLAAATAGGVMLLLGGRLD
jgi:hypothetical protein